MRYLIPFAESADRLSDLDVEVWDGSTPLPSVLDDVEFFVPPYTFDKKYHQPIVDMPALRVVQLLTAGYEHAMHLMRPGLLLANARGVHDASTAELALTLTLAAQRNVAGYVRAADQGLWVRDERPSLADANVLIVGYGSIGEAIERRLAGFEVSVTRVARSARDGVHPISDVVKLLPDADVVILITPLTEETRGLVGADFLAAMKDGALLVNVARGPVVDTDALVAELTSGRLRAALDVTDPEPLPADHPLWSAPNVLISPHVGGLTTAFYPRGRKLIEEQIRRYEAGEPLINIVWPT
ncbi:2-hydroxyacid dehydrogenase [Longispora fulva]|uniref:Phosphoglycerate dehydrogenase-like enzyme n=1 Tax=Longispora fulva TaxID=619741 RepID=A0A8J7GLP5_9ACTN|nr:2-hydroxyacid dehydrogenase [Longispora fulva]MBG6139073.1 phosphoglycerate dehydrogenase-like enzyme [Longispora fulva]